jgi:hypothetical protein
MLESTLPFFVDIGSERAAQHGRVVGEDHAFDAGDDTDAEDGAAANRVIRAPAGQRGDLEEGAVGVEHECDALAHGQLAALGQAFVVCSAAAHRTFGEQLGDLFDALKHGVAVLGEILRAWIQSGAQCFGEQLGPRRPSTFFLHWYSHGLR